MKISEIMSKKVTTLNLTTSLREAAEKMRDNDIGAIPVVDPKTDKIKGMLTDRDIVVRAVAAGKDLDNASVETAMTQKIRYVFEDEDISKAADQMQDQQVRRLVVLNREKRLVGLVSLSDLACRGLSDQLSAKVMKSVSEASASHAMH